MANGDSAAFDTFLGGYKTYVTAALGIIINMLAAFNVWNPTPEQLAAVNGVVVLFTAIFIRMGIKKVETKV